MQRHIRWRVILITFVFLIITRISESSTSATDTELTKSESQVPCFERAGNESCATDPCGSKCLCNTLLGFVEHFNDENSLTVYAYNQLLQRTLAVNVKCSDCSIVKQIENQKNESDVDTSYYPRETCKDKSGTMIQRSAQVCVPTDKILGRRNPNLFNADTATIIPSSATIIPS